MASRRILTTFPEGDLIRSLQCMVDCKTWESVFLYLHWWVYVSNVAQCVSTAVISKYDAKRIPRQKRTLRYCSFAKSDTYALLEPRDRVKQLTCLCWYRTPHCLRMCERYWRISYQQYTWPMWSTCVITKTTTRPVLRGNKSTWLVRLNAKL